MSRLTVKWFDDPIPIPPDPQQIHQVVLFLILYGGHTLDKPMESKEDNNFGEKLIPQETGTIVKNKLERVQSQKINDMNVNQNTVTWYGNFSETDGITKEKEKRPKNHITKKNVEKREL